MLSVWLQHHRSFIQTQEQRCATYLREAKQICGWRLAAGGWRLAAGGLVLAALSACGGGGASEANNTTSTEIIKNAPLTVNAGLNTGVTVLSSSDSVAWKVITRLTNDPDSPATLLQAPAQAVVAENEVFIHKQTAYKVASVKASPDGTQLLYVVQPNINEVFSTFEMTGDLPMGKFDQIQTPQSQKATSSGVVGWKQTGSFEYQKETIRISNKVETVTEIRWPESASEIKNDDYDPAALAELGSCFKVTTDKREIEDGGKKLEVFGFKVAFTCANIKSSSAQGSVGIGAAFDFGVYPKRTFKPGFNLINPNTYKTGIEQSFYTTFSGNVSAAAKTELSKIFRLLSVKTNFIIAVGVVPVTVTIWTPLDLILQAELEGKAKIETSYIGKLLINDMGVNWTTLQPFTNKFDELVSVKVSASVTPYLRPGLGIAVWGMTPFSFHPKVGVKMEFETDVLLDCSKLSFTVLAGLDVVLVPNIWIQVGSLYGEAKRTKEIFAPMDWEKKEFSNNANGCNKPKAVISQFDPNLTAPYTSKILNDGEVRVDALGYFQGGLNLIGSGSLWADNYTWQIVSSSGQAKVVSTSPSYYLTKADIDSIAFPVGVRLTVANGSLLQQKSTSEVRLVGNKAPIVDGLALSDGEVYKLSSFADDLDGKIVQIQWSDTLTGKAVWNSKNQEIITVPVSEMTTVVSSSALPMLKLKVWDNTGEAAEKYIQALLVCNLPKVVDATGTACTSSAPVVNSLKSATAATVGTTTTFTITGTNLPASAPLDITFNGCANIQFVSQSATQHQFTCTPTVADTLTAVIRTLPGTTPLGSFPVVVSAASTATSCANPVTNTLFSEKFASPLNANVWSVDTGGGTVASTIGKLTVSGQGYRFPYIQTLDNPFPASGNYSFYCKANYLNFGPNGTGACIASQTVIPPGSANYAYEAGTLFQWWGDSGQRYITTASTSNSGHSLLFEASIDTGVGTHELETCVIGSTITTYKDGIQIGTATLPTGYMRPTRIWIGNPVNGSSFLPWTSFETHKIEVRQLQ